jgi:hypothetical protein
MRMHQERPRFRQSSGAIGLQKLMHIVAVPDRAREDFAIHLTTQQLRGFRGGSSDCFLIRHIGMKCVRSSIEQ